MRLILTLLLASFAFPGHAQFTPPLGAAPDVAGPRTQMMTVASAHLSNYSGQWKPAWLEPLLSRIVHWQPQLITVENLSGAQCEMMRIHPARYAESFDTYCWDVTVFQRSLKMTQAEAEAEAERRLAAWPNTPTPAQRRDQAMLFMAAGDLGSAMVQWLRLPPAERHAADTLSEEAANRLSRPSHRMNETYDIAAEVAARVGLERIHAVDDHTSDTITNAVDTEFAAWQKARYDIMGKLPEIQAQMALENTVHDGDSMLAYFRSLNAAHAMDLQIQLDFGGAIADPHPKRFGRLYAAWWETRNLRMAANIREAISQTPGVRVMNIVGAEHKPWYDQWARQMGDAEVVDTAAVLAR